jgi:hypothetical protein
VGTHSALAVENVRQHEAAVKRARRQGAAAVVKSVRALFEPASWPETPGFESSPLCWLAEEGDLAGYAVEASPAFLGLLLVESTGSIEEQMGPVASALAAGRQLLATADPAEIVASGQRASPSASVTAARWEGSLLRVAAARAPLPFLFRNGRAVPLKPATDGARVTAECETVSGDILMTPSSGLDRLRFDGAWRPPENLLQGLAEAAAERPLPDAFADAVSDWKNAGISTGTTDLLLLTARRRASGPRSKV